MNDLSITLYANIFEFLTMFRRVRRSSNERITVFSCIYKRIYLMEQGVVECIVECVGSLWLFY